MPSDEHSGLQGSLTIAPYSISAAGMISSHRKSDLADSAIIWPFWSNGLALFEIGPFVNARYSALLATSPSPISTNDEKPTSVITNSFAQTYHLAIQTQSSSDFARLLYMLYGDGFVISQKVQLAIPEIFFERGREEQPFRALPGSSQAVRSLVRVTLSGNTVLSQDATTFLIMCDERSYFSQVRPEALNCGKSVIVEAVLNDLSKPILDWVDEFSVTTGVFFLGSFACTVVFYASLFLFLGSLYVMQLLAVTLPAKLLSLIDVRAVHENSVWIVVAVAGLPLSMLAALAG
jgi:hypothetical protein